MALERESYVRETEEYRALRDELLVQEIALSDQTDRVAELRRQLPTNPVSADYVFREGPTFLDSEGPSGFRDVRLSELFEAGKSTLLVQHVMYSPEDADACPSCSMWADGFSAIAHHVRQRVSFVLSAKADIGKLRAWGRHRGWTNIRLLSSHDSTFNRDFGFEGPDGSQNPGLSVFTLTATGEVRHSYSVRAHMLGEHGRGMDALTPVFNLLDLTPEGRGDWDPSNSYEDDGASPR